MKAVWLVRSRDLMSKMRFWTSIVGYNPHDHSLSQGIYLVYVAIFFILWGFAVLALMANLGAGVLSLFEESSPSMVSTMIAAVVLIIDATIRGYSSGKRSPFIFSDADAELICQTPVDRRQVALAWCLGDWSPGGLAFGALAVVLRFATLQLAESGEIVWSHIPRYILAGLQAASIIVPLHLAFMAIDYALGALRLREDKDNLRLHWIPIGVAVALTILTLGSSRGIQIILWPVLFPLESGFSETHWLAGLILALILAMIGLLVLYFASRRLNLSRAAQESRFQWAVQQVKWLGDSHLNRQLKTHQKLGAGHSASRIPGRTGYSALIWKDWVTTLRAVDFEYMIGWLGIFGVSMGLILAPDWGTRSWAFIIWSLLVGQRCTVRLRADMRVWMITRQLPFSGRETLAAELATPMLVTLMLIWLAIGVSLRFGFSLQTSFIFLASMATLCIVLAAAFDILRQCRTTELLVGQVAELGAGGVVFGMILAGIPLILTSWAASQFTAPGMIWIVTLLGMIFTSGIAYAMWKLTASVYKDIR